MEWLFKIDWHALFVPQGSILEALLRGSLIYLIVFALLRITPKRNTSRIGIPDLLVIVLIGGTAGNAISAGYKTITEATLLIATILFWSYVFDYLDYFFPKLHIGAASPTLLIKDGCLRKKNMHRERISEKELLVLLRQKGIVKLADVKAAYLEGDGGLSVISVGKDR